MTKRFAVMMVAVTGLLMGTPGVRAEDSLCASVKLEISQQLTLERQAFNAKPDTRRAGDNLALAVTGYMKMRETV